MKIGTRLLIVGLLPMAMAAVVAAGFSISWRLIDREAREGHAADEIAKGVYELNFLTDNYQTVPSPRELRQWRAKYESLSTVISDASFSSDGERRILDKIRDDHRKVGDLFPRLIRLYSGETAAGRQDRAMLSSLLRADSLEEFYQAESLVETTRRNLRDIQHKSDIAAMAVLLVTAAVIGFIALHVTRTIRLSVTSFTKATQALAEGNLDVQIETPGENEFGSLAWGFNQMAEKLRKSYSELQSTADILRRENQERKRVEEELRLANRELETRVAERTAEMSRTNRMLELASRHADRLTVKARLETERQKEYDRKLEGLLDLSRRILLERSAEDTVRAIIESARSLLGARYCLTGHGFIGGRFNVDITSRTADAAPCPPGRVFNVERGGVYLEMVARGKVLRLSDAELRRHPQWWGLPEGHAPLRGLLGAPLPGPEGVPIGLIMVSDRLDGEEFSEDDERLLVRLAGLAASALLCVEDRLRCRAVPPEAVGPECQPH